MARFRMKMTAGNKDENKKEEQRQRWSPLFLPPLEPASAITIVADVAANSLPPPMIPPDQ